MKSKFFNKKSIMVLKELVFIIVGIPIILVLLYVGLKLSGVLVTEADPTTIKSWEEVSEGVKILAHENVKEKQCWIDVEINPGFFLAGFNKEGQPNKKHSYDKDEDGDPLDETNRGRIYEHCAGDDEVYRPHLFCKEDACLCLCEDTGFSGGADEEDCLEHGKCIITENVERYVTDIEGQEMDFVLYGESCWGTNKGAWYILITKDFGGKGIYEVKQITPDYVQTNNIKQCKLLGKLTKHPACKEKTCNKNTEIPCICGTIEVGFHEPYCCEKISKRFADQKECTEACK